MPRFPCLLMSHRLELSNGVELMHESKRPGVLFRVLKEGNINIGDNLKLIEKSKFALTLTDFLRISKKDELTRENFNIIKSIPAIPEKTIQRLEKNIRPENPA